MAKEHKAIQAGRVDHRCEFVCWVGAQSLTVTVREMAYAAAQARRPAAATVTAVGPW